MITELLNKWEAREKKMIMFKEKKCNKEMIIDVTCIIYTNKTFDSKLLWFYFREKNLKSIIGMQNKTKIEIEAKIKVSIIKLKEVSYVIGIVILGDCDYLGLLQICKRAQINKFVL